MLRMRLFSRPPLIQLLGLGWCLVHHCVCWHLQCADLAAQLDGVLREKAEVEEGLEVLAGNFAQAGEKLAEQKEQLAAADANLQRANSTIQGLEQQLAEERAAKDAVSTGALGAADDGLPGSATQIL